MNYTLNKRPAVQPWRDKLLKSVEDAYNIATLGENKCATQPGSAPFKLALKRIWVDIWLLFNGWHY
jgi:hypothetical protein